MLFKKAPKYKAAIKAAKLIKKSRNPLEKRLAVRRWVIAAKAMLA